MITRTAHVITSDHVRISLAYRYAQRVEAAVIVCPGFFKSQETRTFRRMSEALAEGRDVIAMDFRGHGRSGGRYTFSAHERADLEAVLAWARPRYQRISLLAFSLGAAIAINTLSRNHAQIESLVTVGAPCDFAAIEFQWWHPEAWRTGLRGLERGSGCRPGNLWLPKERPLDTVGKLGGVPKLFVHGTRDVIVGVEHSRRLYAAAPGPKRLEIIEGGSHAEALFRDDPDGFCALVNDWLPRPLSA